MYRLDPNTYPDRLGFDANARRLRAREFDRLFAAAIAWLARRQAQLTRHFGMFATVTAEHSHRHSPR